MALRSARARGGAGFFFELVLALVARGSFLFRSNGLRSARARGRAGFFFELVLALVARDWFFLLVKWLCAPRGPEAELVFSLSWFSRRWRGVSFLFRSNGFALRAGQRQGGVFRIPPPYLWTPLSPQRVKGFSPLTIPKKWAPSKNAGDSCIRTKIS